jgi:tetratricopeptide (TPR) repeat protein
MAPIKPQVLLPRSLQLLALLCTLALISASPKTLAQEPTSQALDEAVIAAGEAAMGTAARLEARLSMGDLVDEERFAEAIPYAERIAQLTEEDLGASPQLGVALSNLGMLQQRVQLYDVSEQNFLRAVDVIRESEGVFSGAVIRPMLGLGINYQTRGDFLEAMTIFEEARTISRRVNGLMNEQQILILDHLSNTMVSMGRYEEADEFQINALQLQERIHGIDTMEVLPAIYKFARWMRSSYRFYEERLQYTRAIDIIRENAGPQDVALVTALREIGNSFRLQKTGEGRGVAALRQALEIAQAQPETDPRLLAELLVDIGDWRTAFSNVGGTGEEYRQAWALLDELENRDEVRGRWFDNPRYVFRENPSNRGLSDPDDPGVVLGHVLMTFDVDDLGRTRNVTVVESVPPGLKDDSTARALNRSRFRPRIMDGEIVWARGLARNFTFHYLPKE